MPSFFDSTHFNDSTPGVVWLADISGVAGEGVSDIIDGDEPDRRADDQINVNYIENGDPAFFTRLAFIDQADGTILLNLASSSSVIGGSEGPRFNPTESDILYSRENLGLAIKLNDTNSTEYWWDIGALFGNDGIEPYQWFFVDSNNVGTPITSAVVTNIITSDGIKFILVDRAHSNVDLGLLENLNLIQLQI